LSVLVYVAAALVLRGPLDLFSLMVADSLKQITHALATGVLLSRRLNGFARTGLWGTLGKVGLAALVMGALSAGALAGVRALGLPPGLVERLASVAAPGAVGVVVYFGLAARLNVAEVRLAFELIRRRLGV
jgi:hypothetical protein